MGVISYDGINYNLEHLSSNQYILYKDNDLLVGPSFTCSTDQGDSRSIQSIDDSIKSQVENNDKSLITISVYIECDYQLYLDFGSNTTNVSNYVVGLFNVVAGIYASSSVNLSISQIVVYTIPDPYGTTLSDIALAFLYPFLCLESITSVFTANILFLLPSAPLQFFPHLFDSFTNTPAKPRP